MSNRETTSRSELTLQGVITDLVRSLNALQARIEQLEARPTWPVDLRPIQNPDGSFSVLRPSTGGSAAITGPL